MVGGIVMTQEEIKDVRDELLEIENNAKKY